MAEDQPIPPQELKEKVEAFEEQRQAEDDDIFQKMEQHARCVLFPSPEKLDFSNNSPGSDKTDTLKDFALVKEWVKKTSC